MNKRGARAASAFTRENVTSTAPSDKTLGGQNEKENKNKNTRIVHILFVVHCRGIPVIQNDVPIDRSHISVLARRAQQPIPIQKVIAGVNVDAKKTKKNKLLDFLSVQNRVRKKTSDND